MHQITVYHKVLKVQGVVKMALMSIKGHYLMKRKSQDFVKFM